MAFSFSSSFLFFLRKAYVMNQFGKLFTFQPLNMKCWHVQPWSLIHSSRYDIEIQKKFVQKLKKKASKGMSGPSHMASL